MASACVLSTGPGSLLSAKLLYWRAVCLARLNHFFVARVSGAVRMPPPPGGRSGLKGTADPFGMARVLPPRIGKGQATTTVLWDSGDVSPVFVCCTDGQISTHVYMPHFVRGEAVHEVRLLENPDMSRRPHLTGWLLGAPKAGHGSSLNGTTLWFKNRSNCNARRGLLVSWNPLQMKSERDAPVKCRGEKRSFESSVKPAVKNYQKQQESMAKPLHDVHHGDLPPRCFLLFLR